MPNFDIGPLRGASAIEQRVARDNRGTTETPLSTRDTGNAAAPSANLEAGDPPINYDRVAEIKKAIEDGTYPLVPQKIADAMIAAGFLLRTDK
ncbi:MAG: flagellar biosynthesis anti-sigma factor FlgM [Erythrobacter sp.]|nr:flagellar biosynthesis anti-sigma factor FlgM [Erythrobacter sp.]